MMSYSLNEYQSLNEEPNCRIVIFSNNEQAAKLLAFYSQKKYIQLGIEELFDMKATRILMPDRIVRLIKQKVLNQNNTTVITGIDGYLALLNEANKHSFFIALRGFLEEQKNNVLFLISKAMFDTELFINPKFVNSLEVIKITGGVYERESTKFLIFPAQFVKENGYVTNYRELLSSFHSELPEGRFILVFPHPVEVQAGLSQDVHFFTTVSDIAKEYYKSNLPLNDETLSEVLYICKETDQTPEEVIENSFGIENFSTTHVLHRLLQLKDSKLWTAYLWLLKKRLPSDTYISLVLNCVQEPGSLLRQYIVDTAVDCIVESKVNLQQLANERAQSIRLINFPYESMISEFIVLVKKYDKALYFLNCNTFSERCEIVRRAGLLDLTNKLPLEFEALCPELEDYLSFISFQTKILEDYFQSYRINSVTNKVSSNFVDLAYTLSEFGEEIKSRDAILSSLSADEDSALLIVDGMGAEYLPFLIAAANRQQISISYAGVGSVRMPTSTEFNKISWKQDLLERLNRVDNIAHEGRSKHENCTPEENLLATLEVLNQELFKRVRNGLSTHSKVIVTADHGSSRLAVLAYKAGLSKTLEWPGNPDDWRFSVAVNNIDLPTGMTTQYDPQRGKTYWIVKGYNRLPKKGPKLYSLHGGASLEERLVPVVVFTKGKNIQTIKSPKVNQKHEQKLGQIIEKDEFNI